ncbi:hypothetical protein B5S28_g4125 [[Candida] boidinii]|nr:hypothetical protein B5S28_g4125 [[Candida] boidinii]
MSIPEADYPESELSKYKINRRVEESKLSDSNGTVSSSSNLSSTKSSVKNRLPQHLKKNNDDTSKIQVIKLKKKGKKQISSSINNNNNNNDTSNISITSQQQDQNASINSINKSTNLINNDPDNISTNNIINYGFNESFNSLPMMASSSAMLNMQIQASTKLRKHISESSWTIRNWYRHIHWRNFVIVVIIPILGLLGLILTKTKLNKYTLYFTIFNYTITIISINLLYHRYWSHKSFNIKYPSVVLLLTLISSGGGVQSARNWCSAHKAHHRYCDTEYDPHNIRKGLFFSHIGWTVLIHNPKVNKVIKKCKFDDEFENNEIVKWQFENYFSLFLISGLIIPSMISYYFWNDLLGGFFYSGIIKLLMVQHSNFSVNSIGHKFGSRPYDDRRSARDNFLINLITLGEGCQNFHHEFSMDYRNSCEFYHFDITKWLICFLSTIGIITDIKRASKSIIKKSYIQQQQRLLDTKRTQLNWGIPIHKLPVFTSEEFKRLSIINKDKYLVVVSGIIHDVTPFAKDHPGGLPLIEASHGKDATSAFNGAVYLHSNAARNLLATMRIGVISGSEKIVWKQERIENKEVPIDNDADGNRIVRSGEQVTFNKIHSTTAGAA